MRVADLLLLKRDKISGSVPLDVLREALPEVPEDVLEQFLADHGVKAHCQEQFRHIDLRRVQWSLVPVSAAELAVASTHSGVGRRCDEIEMDCVEMDGDIDRFIAGYPDETRASWRTGGTWQRPPIMLDRSLLGEGGGLHLVEGHTRLGTLRGLLKLGRIKSKSLHLAWIGRPVASQEGGQTVVAERHQVPFFQWFRDETNQSEADDELVLWLLCNKAPDESVEGIEQHVELRGPNAARQIRAAARRWKKALSAGKIRWTSGLESEG